MRKKKRASKHRGHQHPELIGLALAAAGVFLSTVIYLGWSGGFAGGLAADGLGALIGAARAVFPAACMIVGALFLARSEILDMRPFRTGLMVFTAGLMLTLGKAHGGYVGTALALGFGIALGSTGVLIVGITTLIAGALLLSGASAGALIRRSGSAVRATAEAAKRARTALPETMPDLKLVEPVERPRPELHAPVLDGVNEFPDVVEADPPGPAPLLLEDPETAPDQTSLFDVGEAVTKDYRLPDRKILRHSPAVSGNSADQNARVAEALVQTLAHARHQGLEGRGAQGRSQLRAGDDGDPHPGADSRQAGCRGRAAQCEPELRRARRHLRRPATDCEPALRLARQGHLRICCLDRPRTDASRPDRRHHRLR